MLLRLCLLASFIFLTCFPESQTSNKFYKILYKKAEVLYNNESATASSDSIALTFYTQIILSLSNMRENDSVLFDCYVKAGIILTSKKNNEQALQLFLKAIYLNDHSSALNDSISFKPYLFAGNSYDDLLNFDSALYCYKKAESLLSNFPALPDAERLYNKTGVLYYEAGDYKKSISYFKKALAIVEEQPVENEYFIVNYKNNIASAYRKLQQYNEALQTYQSLLRYNINYDELLHNIGVTHLDAGNYKEAIACLKQVKYNTPAKFNDIGNTYIKLGLYDSARLSFQAAINLSMRNGAGKNLDYSEALKNTGDLLLQLNEPQQALDFYQNALIQMTPGFNDTVQTHNPVSIHGLQHSFYLFDILIKKAQAYNNLYLVYKKQVYLLNAYQTYHVAIKLSEQMERFYSSDESKFFLKKNVADAYQSIVETGLLLYNITKNNFYLQDVFSYIENNKASVLQANLENLELNTIKGLPTALLTEEKNLKAAISKLNLDETQTGDSSLKAALERKMSDLEIRLSTLQTSLDENEKYHELKSYSKQLSIDSIQKNVLAKDEAIISYYATQQSLLCFYITKNNYGYIDTKQLQLKERVSALRKALNEPQSSDRSSMQTLITSISDVLIKPVFDKIKNAKRLIVIPYNEISYVPFEALYEPGTNNVLLNRFVISYNYSINFLSANENSYNKVFSVLSVAPFTNSTNQRLFPQLKSSLDEIKDLPGKQLVSANATKKIFLDNTANFSIIHLATHAVANDTLPLHSYIAFYPETNDTGWHLYEPEIYYLNLTQTQLVVLSACETGSGELVNGEGIMSLSRAFSYAGCRSVITSLWKADDIATAFIIRHMHQYLEKGYAKDEALQKAKLDYLNSDDIEARYKTPPYWAHLILIGDYHAVAVKHFYWFWITLLAVALTSIILFRKRISSSFNPKFIIFC